MARFATDDGVMTTPEAPAGELQPGARIENFTIEAVIGRGGHGPMYLARGPDPGIVAIKEYAPGVDATADAENTDDSSAGAGEYNVEFTAGLTLFRLMGQALCAVRHPNMVPIRRCIEARGTAYLIMDYIEGADLDDVPGKGGPRSDTALEELLLAILGALDQLHTAGLIHRDIKPANIRLDPTGVPVLVDFGAALPADLAAEPPYRSQLTPGYAAPEQYRKDAREGPWTDFYSLAAVAYKIISGAPPPDAPARVSGKLLVPAVDVGRGRFAEALLASIDRALSLQAVERPQSAKEWIAALRSLKTAHAKEAAIIGAPEPAIADAPAGADKPHAQDAPAGADKPDAPGAPAGADGVDAARAAPRARRLWRWTAAAVLVLMTLPAAVIGGRSYYLAHIKSEWIVDASGNGDVKSITEAMTTARTDATIKVRPGRYPEALVMARPFTVRGDGDAAEIIIAAPGSGPCITITAEAGAISGLSLIGGTSEPQSSADACVDIAGGSTITVSGTIINNAAGPGLRIRADATPVVRANRIEKTSGPAIIVQEHAGGTITANAIVASGTVGILVRDTAAPLVMGNRIDSVGQAGILLTGDSAAHVTENQITNSAWSGIEVRGGADPAVAGNRIDGAGQAGIYIYGGGRGTYERNIIVGSAFSGVVVSSGGSPVMTGNRIATNKEHGILVLAHGAGRYHGNTITDNAGYGIAIDVVAQVERGDVENGDNVLTGNRDPQIVIGETPAPHPEP